MDRRVTGWLAWGALALVIGVPSVEIVFSDSEEAAAVNIAETSPDNGFFGPMPKPAKSKTNPFAQPSTEVAEDEEVALKETAVAGTAESAPTQGEAAPRVTDVARVILPSGVQRSSVGTVQSPRNAGSVVELDEEVTETAKVSDATLEPIESRSGSSKELKTAVAEPDVTEPGSSDTGTEKVADIPAETEKVAPVPLPASLRPAAPTRVAAVSGATSASASFEDDVRRSIENLRASRGPAQMAPREDSVLVWGDDPRYREGEVLEPFAPGEFVGEDYAGDSEFYEIWREERQRPAGFRTNGSFAEQLPPRRGNGVRLDLLQ